MKFSYQSDQISKIDKRRKNKNIALVSDQFSLNAGYISKKQRKLKEIDKSYRETPSETRRKTWVDFIPKRRVTLYQRQNNFNRSLEGFKRNQQKNASFDTSSELSMFEFKLGYKTTSITMRQKNKIVKSSQKEFGNNKYKKVAGMTQKEAVGIIQSFWASKKGKGCDQPKVEIKVQKSFGSISCQAIIFSRINGFYCSVQYPTGTLNLFLGRNIDIYSVLQRIEVKTIMGQQTLYLIKD